MRRNVWRLWVSGIFLCGFVCAMLAWAEVANALTWISEERGSSFLLYEGTEMDCLWKNARMKNAAFLSDAESGLLREADLALRTLTQTVTEKSEHPVSGDIHYYASLDPEYFPVIPGAGRKYLRRAGETNGEIERYDRYDFSRIVDMTRSVHALSVAYFFTRDERYAVHAATLLRTWFVAPETRMRPNLRFARGFPGGPKGRPDGIEEGALFIPLLDDLRMLDRSNALTGADRNGLIGWFDAYLAWLSKSPFGKKALKTPGRLGVWTNAQIAVFADFLGKRETARRAVLSGRGQIDRNIEPDGVLSRQVLSPKPQEDVFSTLAGLVTLARIGEKTGVDLWGYRSKDGRTLREAFRLLDPYLEGASPWPWGKSNRPSLEAFSRYLAMASSRCGGGRFDAAVQAILGDSMGDERLSSDSFLGLFCTGKSAFLRPKKN